MANLNSPESVERQLNAIIALLYCCLGIWLTDYAVCFKAFDWKVIRKVYKFRPTMLIYWANRMFSFILIVSTICQNVYLTGMTSLTVNCVATSHLAMFFGMAVTIASSLGFAMRALALWSRRPAVMYYIIAGQTLQIALAIAIIATDRNYYSKTNEAIYGACAANAFLMGNNIHLMTAFYIISILFDISILGLMVFQLRRKRTENTFGQKHSLSQVLFKQGVAYVLVTIVLLVPVAVTEILHLSDIFVLMFMIPASTLQSIWATRSIMGLYIYAADISSVISGKDYTPNSSQLSGSTLKNAYSGNQHSVVDCKIAVTSDTVMSSPDPDYERVVANLAKDNGQVTNEKGDRLV